MHTNKSIPGNKWQGLQTAPQITTVIESLAASVQQWATAAHALREDERKLYRAALNKAFTPLSVSLQISLSHALHDAATRGGYDHERRPSWQCAWFAACDTAVCLAAWPDSAELLDLVPDALRDLMAASPDQLTQYAAALLLPYAIVKAAA